MSSAVASISTEREQDLTSHRMQTLVERLAPLRRQLATHPLYRSMRSIEDVRCFMEAHVFAVWDFMSLLKSLQRGLTCVDVPWTPSATPLSRRLINEIVFGEESDVYEGEALSHFELYLRAMRQSEADTTAIDAFLTRLRAGDSVSSALEYVHPAESTCDFVRTTFGFIASGRLHVVAAAFTFGREDIIPAIFTAFLEAEDKRLAGQLSIFRWYLDRHIEVDSDEHGPLALRMVADLCGESEQRWHEAEDAAARALEARLTFWDGIVTQIAQQSRRT